MRATLLFAISIAHMLPKINSSTLFNTIPINCTHHAAKEQDFFGLGPKPKNPTLLERGHGKNMRNSLLRRVGDRPQTHHYFLFSNFRIQFYLYLIITIAQHFED